MAFTIQQTPDLYSSLHDDIIYTVAYPEHTSDSVAYPNYKFIGDVYIGGVLVARIKKVQDPVTGIGIFNIGQVVRNYLTTIFDPAPGQLVAQEMGDGVFRLTVVMNFGEEYGFTSYDDLLEDSPRIFLNNYNGKLVGITTSYANYLDKVASNRPPTGQTFLSSSYNFLPYFPTSTDEVTVTITPFGDGAPYTGSFTPANAFDLQSLNVAPVVLNTLQAGTVTPATTYYIVAIGEQAFRFNVICEAMFQTYMFHFLNQYGGFESKIFSKVSRLTMDITKKDFGKLRYTVNSDGLVSYKSDNGVYNETRSVYSSQYVEKLAVNSDFLNDQEYTWLKDLILSPMVYIEDGGYLYPCVITDNNYEPKKVVNDDLTNLTMNIEYGQTLNAQYR